MHALCEQLLRDMVCLYSLVEHMCDDGIEAYPTDTMENWRGGRGGGLNQKPATPEDEPTEYQQVFECDENNLVMSVASGAVRLTTFDTSSLVSFRLTVYEPGIDLGLIIANTPEEHSDAYDYEKRPGACVWTSKVVAVLHRGI